MDLDTLTALLLDPFLTTGEAAREAAATPRRNPVTRVKPRRPAADAPEEAAAGDDHWPATTGF